MPAAFAPRRKARRGGSDAGLAMIIRDARPADLSVVVEIYNQSVPGRMATADTVPVTIESRREWFAHHAPDDYPLWVMDTAAGVVGWLGFSPWFNGRPAYRATAEVSFYVANEMQGRGIGRALLSHALAQGPSLGLTALVGAVFGHNTPSLRLLERSGFARWGLLPGIALLDGVHRDLVILGRCLDPAE